MDSSSRSNFIYDQNPSRYGGNQNEYIQQRDKAIASRLTKLEQIAKTGQDLKQFFFETISDFATVRHQWAVSCRSEESEYFGRRRWDVLSDVTFTDLVGPYKSYNDKITDFLSNLLKGKIPFNDYLSEKKIEKEEICLGRTCKFEVELLDAKDMSAREWDRPVHTGVAAAKKDPQINSKLETVDETRFPPTEKDQKIINAFKQNLKLLKQRHNAVYIHMKMHPILKGLCFAFPSPKLISIPGQGSIIEGNENYLKNLYLHCKVRIEINGKLYGLSEYVTWSYQDLIRDPGERIKNSVVVIIHQDQFLIDDTLADIAKVFESAMQWNPNTDKLFALQEKVGLIRYLFAHCMPCQRGSGAIGEWLEIFIYRAKGFDCKHNPQKMGDLEALTAPLLSTFLSVYPTTIELSPLKS